MFASRVMHRLKQDGSGVYNFSLALMQVDHNRCRENCSNHQQTAKQDASIQTQPETLSTQEDMAAPDWFKSSNKKGSNLTPLWVRTQTAIVPQRLTHAGK